MKLVDTHAHLYFPQFQDDLEEVINRAKEAGVGVIINIGVDPEASKNAAQLENNQIKLYSSVGIHPHNAKNYLTNSNVSIQQDIKKLEKIYQSNAVKIVLIGECGLDFLFDPEFVPSTLSLEQLKQIQIDLFQAQIKLAKKLQLPLSVHCRDDRSQNPANAEAWNKVIEMTTDHFGIYHCYSGLLKTTERIIKETNFLVSFAATLTYPKNDYLIEAVKILPLERIVLETDCPFLPPQSKRGTRNEPITVTEVAQKIAEIKKISLEAVATQTTTNALKLFNIGI